MVQMELAPFTFDHFFGKVRAWMGHGGGAALRESTGRELRFHRRSQRSFRKERRKALGPVRSHGKTSALWFRDARSCPLAPVPCLKHRIPLGFGKGEGGQVKRQL